MAGGAATVRVKGKGPKAAPKVDRSLPSAVDTITDLFKGMPTKGWTLFDMTVRNILYDKKTVIFFGLTIFMLILPCYWAYTWEDNGLPGLDLFVGIAMVVYIQFIVLYACLLFGSSLFSEEEEQRTMTFLTSRPISNLEIVLYKYAGFVASVFVMMVIPLLINFGIIAMRTPFEDTTGFLFELGQFIGLIFMAIMAWGAFFMFLGIMFRKYSLIVGLLYALFWETFVANIPTSIRYGTVGHYARSMAPIYFSFSEETSALEPTGWGWALGTLLGFAIAMIVLSYIVLKRKDFH